MAKVGEIYILDLSNYSDWITLAHKERVYKNCHRQFAQIVAPHGTQQGWYEVKMLTGPRKDNTLIIDQSWFFKKGKIKCDCPKAILLNQGCQKKNIHE